MSQSMNGTRQGQLHCTLLDLWHAGSGRGAGRYLDSVVVTDTKGLPYLPGRQLRGILRDALASLQEWGHVTPGTVERIFGAEAPEQEDGLRHRKSEPGTVAIGNARMQAQTYQWLAQVENADLRRHLFMDVFSTAIDPQSGVAADASLRGMQVCVPMDLFAPISLEAASEQWFEADWAALTLAARAIRHVGAHRSRGYGRASVRLSEGAPQ